MLNDHRTRVLCDPPQWVPWEVVARSEARAIVNHQQGLDRLAARGGLDPVELWCLVHDKPLFPLDTRISYEDALDWVRSIAC